MSGFIHQLLTIVRFVVIPITDSLHKVSGMLQVIFCDLYGSVSNELCLKRLLISKQ